MSQVIGEVAAAFCGLVALLCARRPSPMGSHGEKGPWILAVIQAGPSRILLQAISEETGLDLTLTDNVTACITYSTRTDVPPIVIYDREIPSPQWREGVRSFANMSPRPYIMLLSSNADANLWDEVQRVGGSDIVRSPIDRDSLLSAVRKAWRLWSTQQRVRPPDSDIKR